MACLLFVLFGGICGLGFARSCVMLLSVPCFCLRHASFCVMLFVDDARVYMSGCMQHNDPNPRLGLATSWVQERQVKYKRRLYLQESLSQ